MLSIVALNHWGGDGEARVGESGGRVQMRAEEEGWGVTRGELGGGEVHLILLDISKKYFRANLDAIRNELPL